MHYIVSVSSFATILKRKGKVVALLLLSFRCTVTIDVLLLFLTVPWVGLQREILVFPDHIHLLLYILKKIHFYHIRENFLESKQIRRTLHR